MNSKLILLPYKANSEGSKLIAEALNINRVLRDERFEPDEAYTCINWGRGDNPVWHKNVREFINTPDSVAKAIDKLTSFQAFKRNGVPTPPWTTKPDKAKEWTAEGKIVFCRTTLHGMDGDGIVVATKPEEVVYAHLYTEYIPCVREFRVHAANWSAFYSNIKQKAKANADEKIRTTSGGWYFKHMDVLPSNAVADAAMRAVYALGLDFGGVDVGESEDGRAFVYEVNTAPETGPNTAAAYKKMFKEHYGEYKNKDGVELRQMA